MPTDEPRMIKIALPEGSLEASGSDEWLQKIRAALGYVLTGNPQSSASPETRITEAQATLPSAPDQTDSRLVTDIRTLHGEKQPKDAIEMSAVVAYYLSDRAPSNERRTTINAADITKYFGQAQFRSKTKPGIILHRAKNAGYLDSAGPGQYKLNPVGFNLVTAGLPASQSRSARGISKKRSGKSKRSRNK